MQSAAGTVLYDDTCPLCVSQVRWLTRLDWFRAVSFLPISDARAGAVAPGIPRAELLAAIHCVAGNGTVCRGARCFRFLAMRLPLLVPVGALLWIPGMIQLAETIYRWISRNRYRLSRWFGCKDSCAPPRTDDRND